MDIDVTHEQPEFGETLSYPEDEEIEVNPRRKSVKERLVWVPKGSHGASSSRGHASCHMASSSSGRGQRDFSLSSPGLKGYIDLPEDPSSKNCSSPWCVDQEKESSYAADWYRYSF